jgi:hypothetical protein
LTTTRSGSVEVPTLADFDPFLMDLDPFWTDCDPLLTDFDDPLLMDFAPLLLPDFAFFDPDPSLLSDDDVDPQLSNRRFPVSLNSI